MPSFPAVRGMRWIHLVAATLLGAGLFTTARAQHGGNPAPAAALEGEARKLQLAPGLAIHLWAAEPQLQNPVAFSLAPVSPSSPAGVEAYVAETHRYGVSVLDITQNTPWLLNDLSLRSTADRSAFLLDRFATNAAVLTRDSELVRHLADRDGDGRAEHSAVLAAGFQSELDGTAAGILAQGPHVWFANIPHLWRLPRVQDGKAARESLAQGFGVHIGVTGHDLHGLVLGPDQRLYASFGDRGLSITNREGRVLHAPDTGGVVRCNLDGSELTLFCIGLRNPQELAFDHAGNLFTSDNDTAGADPCRVLHLIEGADYGWRAAYQHMKGFGPWVQEELWRGDLDGILPPAGTVAQGPAGLAFYPGTGFGDRFAGRFVHCDFPGGVWSFSLRPQDGTFVVESPEKVAWNCWPTDVEFGPDGALYLLDWVAGWGVPRKGRIYRLTDPSQPAGAALETYRLLARDPSRDPAPVLLEQLAHADSRVRLVAQWELARRGRDSLPQLLTAATTDPRSLARRHALWGIAQVLRRNPPDSPYRDGGLLLEIAGLTRHGDVGTVVQAVRLLREFSCVEARNAVASLLSSPEPRLRIEALLATTAMADPSHRSASADPWVKRALLTLFGKSGVVTQLSAAQPYAHVLGNGTSERLAPFEYVARGIAGTPSPESILLSPQFGGNRGAGMFNFRRPALLALRRRASPAITNFLADPAPLLVLEAVRAIHDQPIPEALPALAALLDSQRFAPWTAFDSPAFTQGRPVEVAASPTRRTPRDQILRRVLNAHFRLGQSSNAVALARYAAQATAPADLRAEALFLLARWETTAAAPGRVPVFPAPDPNHGAVPSVNPENWPGWFDRVTGAWRPLPPRSADAARDALAPFASTLVLDAAEPVALAALEAAHHLGLAQIAPAVATRIADTTAPPALRAAALPVLASLDSSRLPASVAVAFASGDSQLESAAVPYLDHLGGETGTSLLVNRLKSELDRLPLTPTASTPPRLAQALVQALGKSTAPAAVAARNELGRRLIGHQLPAALELEVAEALQHGTDAEARALHAQWLAQRPPTADSAGTEVLHGGDPLRGAALFAEKAETQCARCHQVAGSGGIVGPPLDQVGARLTRAQLLESIVNPNASIATGYESVTLTLSDGRELFGTVRRESDSELLLLSPEDGEVTVVKARIQERRKGLSAMPEGLAPMLSRRELRDLIEYLARLRPAAP